MIERGRKDKLPALRNVPKKKLLEEKIHITTESLKKILGRMPNGSHQVQI